MGPAGLPAEIMGRAITHSIMGVLKISMVIMGHFFLQNVKKIHAYAPEIFISKEKMQIYTSVDQQISTILTI